MEVLEPRPLDGGWRCTASPPQKTRPFGVLGDVGLVDVPGREVLSISISRSGSPTSTRILAVTALGIEVGLAVGHVVAPAGDPVVPGPDGAQQAHADLAEAVPGVMIQCRMLGRCST